MVFEIEKELGEALSSAIASGDKALVVSCKLSAAPGSDGTWSVDVKAETEAAAFVAMHRMVNDAGVPIERARQLRLYLAWKGHVDSQFLLAENFRMGRNIAKNLELSRYWMEKAAEGGDVAAQNNIGVMYAEGIGGPRDMEKALCWYGRSAEGGSDVAKGNLGANIAMGNGVRRNYMAAARLLKESLRNDPFNSRSHLLLAECYEHGVGGRNGPRLAIRHYQEASDFGSLEARAALRRLGNKPRVSAECRPSLSP